ncbi:MAG: 16S rRNA (cytosine(1402)-N(4))-methyltransferase RsmH [Paludibacteraceae bacterium]|nr:16S rRNA (cytosine(1402)-N(4))-methyltransferase RsmH [Paludibacteraceae bacterium]
MSEVYHIPAMLQETISGMNVKPDGVYVDVTFGGGGHSRAILEAGAGRLYSFDQDIEAYQNAIDDPRWQFVHGNFRYLANFMDYFGVTEIDGLIADLGVSFHHFDDAERGFSFRFDAPLDMRMNQQGGRTAADLINNYSEDELSRVLALYGELKNARPLARRLIQARPVATTGDVLKASGISGEIDPRRKKELTCLFQALRIEVNDELAALREMLVAARDLLKPGGRIAVLTYHSLEDRIVKNFLRSGNLEGEIEKDFYGNMLTPFKLIEKGRSATEEEVARNPRARSAKLRVAEKV